MLPSDSLLSFLLGTRRPLKGPNPANLLALLGYNFESKSSRPEHTAMPDVIKGLAVARESAYFKQEQVCMFLAA